MSSLPSRRAALGRKIAAAEKMNRANAAKRAKAAATTEATLPKCRTALIEKFGRDEKGEANVGMWRSPAGYYYFDGHIGCWTPSLYTFNIRNWTVQEVLDHVADDLANR